MNDQRKLSLVPLIAVVLSAMLMSGCSQLKALFETRPSEQMPAYHPVQVEYPDQHWSPEQRQWFYHAGQGTELLPYKWFLALEQPKIRIFGTVPLFSESDYLARFGFLPDAVGPQNPDGLPVGFAKDTVVDP